MYVEMIDLLRCPRPHDDSWLVVAAEETAARHVVRGVLGCPVCHAEYPVRDAVADFGRAPDAAPGALAARADDDALRVAALLGLGEQGGGTIALGGTWAALAADVMALASVRVLALDPDAVVPMRDDLSAVHGGGRIPVAHASLRGVALDARSADAPRLAAAVEALASRGRLMAPATTPLPDGVTELARDDRLWIAERGAVASRPIALGRARP